MADSKKPKTNTSGTIGMVIGLIGAAAPIITAALDKIPAKEKPAKLSEPLVIVPDLYAKGFPLTLEQASEKLTSEGFKVISSKMALSDAKPKYRECLDTQVVDSRPKSGTKVKPGTTVIVRYITQEVVDESRRMFDDAEAHKAELRAQKTITRQKQVEQTKEVALGVVTKATGGVRKIFNRQTKE